MIEIRRRISAPFSGVSGIPATVAEPEVGAISVPSVRTVVVLPGAVRPEEAEHLAVADLERDVVERDPVTEALAQPRRGQRRGTWAAVCGDHTVHAEISWQRQRARTRSSCRTLVIQPVSGRLDRPAGTVAAAEQTHVAHHKGRTATETHRETLCSRQGRVHAAVAVACAWE